MSESSLSPQTISRTGLDGSFAHEEQRKSNLLLEAQVLHDSGNTEKGADLFAEAAQIEQRLAERCAEAGLHDKRVVHHFSAASCWAHAGDFHHALSICKQILSALPESHPLQTEIGAFAKSVQAQRNKWYANLFVETAA